MKLAIIIPAHNEAKTISRVIRTVPKKIDGVHATEIIVVDDNSSDETYRIAKQSGAHVLSHAMNLGQGGAILTGTAFSQRINADLVVTLDADGQHDPREISRFVKKYQKERSDLVIGSRFLSQTIKAMPAVKKFGNQSFSYVTYLFSGQMVSDSQSGFRLFSRSMRDLLLTADLAGYEFCSEMIMLAGQHQLTISEVPITTIYDSARRGGQSPINGINIVLRLFYRKLVG